MQNNSHKVYSKQKLYTYILLIFCYEKSCFFAINFNCEPVVKHFFFFLLHRTNCKAWNFSSCFFLIVEKNSQLENFTYCSNHWIIITSTQQNLFFVYLFLNWQNFEKLSLKLPNLIYKYSTKGCWLSVT